MSSTASVSVLDARARCSIVRTLTRVTHSQRMHIAVWAHSRAARLAARFPVVKRVRVSCARQAVSLALARTFD